MTRPCPDCKSPARGNPCWYFEDHPEEAIRGDPPCVEYDYIEDADRSRRRFRRRFWKAVAVLFFVIVVLVIYSLSTKRAPAQEHMHGDRLIDAEVGKFYGSWMQPSNRMISCCNRLDCDSTQARMDNGRWRAFSRLQNRWIDIPASKIEREREVPPGAHLCENTSGVICFGAGSGS